MRHFNLAYSALACLRMGMFGSAPFHNSKILDHLASAQTSFLQRFGPIQHHGEWRLRRGTCTRRRSH